MVKTADIKYAFERAFSKEVPSGYAGTYFSSIAGTPAKPNTGDIKPISGIETPDDTTIVFHLQARRAAGFPGARDADHRAGPQGVRGEVRQEDAVDVRPVHDVHRPVHGQERPEDRQGHRARAGQVDHIVRNPNWDKSTDYRPAYLDEIQIQEGNDDLATAARRALSGNATVCCDTSEPPAQVLKQAVTHQKDQALFAPAGGVLYIAFNTTEKPFDNINIRKAIIAASDREALRLTQGGAVSGGLASGWIPPGLPGYAEAGGPKQNTDLDYLANPKGDPAVAKKYMLAAKQQDASLPIDASGKWTGGEKALTIAGNADPNKKTAEVFQNQMEQLGFKVNLRLVPVDTLFTKFCGVPSQKVGICPNVGWFRDFADAQSMLDATFNGNNILQQGNVNWPQLNVSAINDAMKAASLLPVGAARSKAWAKVNHMIAEQAPAIPYVWPNNGAVQSKDVVGVLNGYYTTHDLGFTSLKQG